MANDRTRTTSSLTHTLVALKYVEWRIRKTMGTWIKIIRSVGILEYNDDGKITIDLMTSLSWQYEWVCLHLVQLNQIKSKSNQMYSFVRLFVRACVHDNLGWRLRHTEWISCTWNDDRQSTTTMTRRTTSSERVSSLWSCNNNNNNDHIYIYLYL